MNDHGYIGHMNRVLDVVNANIAAYSMGANTNDKQVDYTWIKFSHDSENRFVLELFDRTQRMEIMEAIKLVNTIKDFCSLIGVEIVAYEKTSKGLLFVLRV